MVNCTIVSQYADGPLPKAGDDQDRTIPGGPLYPPDDVLRILDSQPTAIHISTRRCAKNIKDDGLDNGDVKGYLQRALRNGRFKNSEWCSLNNDGFWAACDAYVTTVSYWNDFASKDLEVEYYLKFAIGKNGNIILTVSCHK